MTKLTEASIQAARQQFAESYQACIDEVESGAVRVNDKEAYYAWRRQSIVEVLAGRYDHTLAFLQRAHYIQTGECVPLLPM